LTIKVIDKLMFFSIAAGFICRFNIAAQNTKKTRDLFIFL